MAPQKGGTPRVQKSSKVAEYEDLNYEMPDKSFIYKIETRECSNMSRSVVSRLNWRINDEMRVLVFAFFLWNFPHHFQPNNNFKYETPIYLKFRSLNLKRLNFKQCLINE